LAARTDYPYYDHRASEVRIDEMLTAFEAIPSGDVVLLQDVVTIHAARIFRSKPGTRLRAVTDVLAKRR
jgi:hypothetical protein